MAATDAVQVLQAEKATVLIAVLALGAIVCVRALRSPKNMTDSDSRAPSRSFLAIVCGVLVVVYVLALAVEIYGRSIGFPAATFVFVVAIGMTLAKNRRAMWPVAGLALALALGLSYLLTQVFVIDLP